MESLKSLLETSKNEKKGVMVYLNGQSIPGLVTEINDSEVILANQEYSKIVLHLDKIDGAALS